VNSDKIEASYDKGVLKIVLPKKEEIKAKQIEIK
jgi:HSP20 family molecular chaperone IbpA